MYFPNRFMDMLDIMTFEFGVGPRVGIGVFGTNAAALRAQGGFSVDMIKAYDRQFGFAKTTGWDAQFIWMNREETQRLYTSMGVRPYRFSSRGMLVPGQEIFASNTRDYWELGCEVSALVHVRFAIHPVEIADLLLGFFMIDIRRDDY